MQLLDLISAGDLEHLRTSFEDAVGVPILFTDAEGKPLLPRVDLDRFCVAFLTGTGAEDTIPCLWCRRRESRAEAVRGMSEAARAQGRPVVDTCPGGFLDTAVPIAVDGRVLGYGLFARTLDRPIDPGAYDSLAAAKGLDPEACRRIAAAAAVLPRERVEAVARHLALVTDLVVRSAASRFRAQRELDLAGEIQRGLIPSRFFVDGFDVAISFRSGSTTGGDLMNAFRLGGGDAVFYAGDVAGSGVPAALIMSLLSGLLGAARHANVWPAGVVTELNGAFRRHFEHHRRFATLFHARFVESEGALIYVNAGHEPAFLVRGDTGETVEMAEPAYPPVGLGPDPELAHGRCALGVGDTFVLYTDGVIERKDKTGRWLDPGDLRELVRHVRSLPVGEAAEAVVTEIEERCGRREVPDDQGLLLARREEVHELAVPSGVSQVSTACRYLCAQLKRAGADEETTETVRLALDEAVTNAVRHGNREDPNRLVRIRYSLSPRRIKVSVIDEGAGIRGVGSKPVSVRGLAGSGYGLALVRQVMDHVEWSPGGNEVFMVKDLAGPGGGDG